MRRQVLLFIVLAIGCGISGCRDSPSENAPGSTEEKSISPQQGSGKSSPQGSGARPGQESAAKNIPEGYQQLLPRGGIPAIDNPQYVSADEAEIEDQAFVFGVILEGQAFAYSLNLLNGHEVVNDTVGSTNFAAVW